MGILDGKSQPNEILRRQRVLRANLHQNAESAGKTYKEAVSDFAELIGRSPATILMWVTSGETKMGGHRPIPKRHFDTLVDKGVLNNKLTTWKGKPADPKVR